MPSRYSTDYRNLRPYVLEDVRAAVQAAVAGGLAAKYGVALTAHRLDDTTVHIGTLDANQFPRGLLRDGTRSLTNNLSVDVGVTIDGVDLDAHAANPDAHHARAHVLATAAGLGADHSMSGAAAGQVLRANSATNAMWAYLSHNDLSGVTADQHHAKQHDVVDAANHTVSGAAWNVVGATAVNTLGLLLARSDATGTPKETLLKSDAAGALSLTALYAPLLGTATGNITAQPAGDWIFDPVGNDVLPATNYDINLGALFKKYLTIHAAELWVETLVAQNTIATIGGRILVGPTTTLTRDLAAAATTIYVKHNQMISGDRTYMEAAGSVEFFAITSGATLQGAGDYAYTVTRDLDGTGANQWYAGDAMFNTGQTGNGFIDLYSVRGVKTASQAGPTIVGNVRTGSTYNAWAERWAAGNLNGLYGYGTNVYGFAAGDPTTAWLAMDATNGVRMMAGSQTRLLMGITGNLRLYDNAGTPVISLDNDGSSYFAGVMTIGTGGEIRQGTGTLGSNYTGLRIWRDTNVGRIAGYNNNTLQWYAGTDGYLYAGAGKIRMSDGGLAFGTETAAGGNSPTMLMWYESLSGTTETGRVYSYGNATNHGLYAHAYAKSGVNGKAVFGVFTETNATLTGLYVNAVYSGGTWSYTNDLYGNTTVNANLTVTGTINGYAFSATGNRWGVLPYVETDGVMEVGKYQDWHATAGSTADYAMRTYLSSTNTFGGANSNGYFEVGARTTGYCHFMTDRAAFYFDKWVAVNGAVSSYAQDLVLQRDGATKLTLHGTGGTLVGALTMSTVYNSGTGEPAAPSTGAVLYIWDTGSAKEFRIRFAGGSGIKIVGT